ncbi:NADH-quinone oxidoreductase subunit J family protein [Nonomuraea jabiensis]|uniref:NADH-quinone oxidoreductase subunit J n=1 Tax=Nonomuraea jabiensis TaxID=882448 RepID=A0A7W9G3R1_9ACTN|nr:NADH-quinone oxidoreductase subunit J [Nonomuraea jabiensis]MBB5776568.1 NADH-quinone oxidoreductase subunit J [Nonomuraea jabiensis]
MTEAVPSYLSPTGQEIVFLLLGAVAVGSALLVVTTKQLVHAALWLVVSFGALAGCYLVLTAEFVAWVQVLIYVGAVVVLLLFGIMLTRAPIGRSTDLDSGNRLVAALVAVATAAILVTVVIDGFHTAYTPLTPGQGAAKELGASVFATWVLPFEALSVLLLAALIGAIVLSRTDIPGGAPSAQTERNTPSRETSVAKSPTGRGPAPEQARGHSTGTSTRTGDRPPSTHSGQSSPARPETRPSPPDTGDNSVPDRTGGNLPPDQTGGH